MSTAAPGAATVYLDEPTLPLSFDALSAEAAHRLTRRLTDTARHHGVLVYPN